MAILPYEEPLEGEEAVPGADVPEPKAPVRDTPWECPCGLYPGERYAELGCAVCPLRGGSELSAARLKQVQRLLGSICWPHAPRGCPSRNTEVSCGVC